MFRLESYITPLVMNYIDRYVKLKTEDFQLSLWSGAAVLNKLDLRLDAIETALNLPVKLSSGQINELKIQVPWTKLGFEPVVVTIHTMECVLSLRNASDMTSDTSSLASSQKSSIQTQKTPAKKQKPKKKSQEEDMPPGYVQSLLNRVVNNVNIVIENLILKFVEEDIVLSINVKTLEVFSVNNEWKRAFVDLTYPDLILRRLVKFTDLTVCLDKTDGDGKISQYQDPLIYKCSLQTRVHSKYDSIHSKYPTTTKVHTMCDLLNVSITDTQLPMFIRLVELSQAIYYGELDLHPTPSDDTKPEDSSSAEDESPKPNTSIEAVEDGQQGWASWAWSMVPQVLPGEEGSRSDDEAEYSQPEKPKPPIFSIGFYNRQATLVFKLTRLERTTSRGTSKVTFDPLVELRTAGVSLEILVRGLLFLDVQIGLTSALVAPISGCLCGTSHVDHKDEPLLIANAPDSTLSTSQLYLRGCLFDASEFHGSISTYIFDQEQHNAKYKESWAIERFGALWINYLWIEKPPAADQSPDESSVDEKPEFLEETSHMKFWFHDVSLNYTSNMRHRLDAVLYSASNHKYQPYSTPKPENVDSGRRTPSPQQISFLEEFIPLKNIHLAVLRSRVYYHPSDQSHLKITENNWTSIRNARKPGKKQRASLAPLVKCSLNISAERFDMQITRPMYPRKLVRLVSKIDQPSGNLLYHCQYHQNIKVMRLHAELHSREKTIPIMLPVSAAYYRNCVMLSVYWKEHSIELSSQLYEVPDLTITLSMPQLQAMYAILNSWISSAGRCGLFNTSLLDDAFDLSGKYSLLDISFSRLEMKKVETALSSSGYGSFGGAHVALVSKDESEKCSTVLQCPVDTSLIGFGKLFTSSQPIKIADDDFMSFTYQIPVIDQSADQHSCDQPALVVLLNVKGWTVTADPLILQYLLYEPERNEPELVDVTLAESSIPKLSGQTSITSQTGDTMRSEIDAPSKPPNEAPVSLSSKDSTHTTSQPSTSSLHWIRSLTDWHRFTNNMALNVNLAPGGILVPLTSLPAEDSVTMPETWRQLFYNGELPSSLVVSIPSLQLTSQGVKLKFPLEDIPINLTSLDSCLPVQITFSEGSIYTVTTDTRCSYFLQPVGCQSTVTFVKPSQQASSLGGLRNSLALNIKNDIDALAFNVSRHKLQFLLDIFSVWIKGLPMAFKVTSAMLSSKKEFPKPSSLTVATSTGIPTSTYIDDESIPAVTDSDFSMNRNKSVAAECLPESQAPHCYVQVSVKIPRATANWLLENTGTHSDACINTVCNEFSGTLELHEEHTKLTCKLWVIETLFGIYDMRLEEFVQSSGQGIIFSTKQRVTNLEKLTANTNSRSQGQRLSTGNLVEEKPHSEFATFIYTRALSKNFHQRLSSLDPEKASGHSKHAGHTDDYISEVCLDLAHIDAFFKTDVAYSLLKMTSLRFPKISTEHLSGGDKPYWKSKKPLIHSKSLPLLHFSLKDSKLILPVDIDNRTDRHDTFVMSISALVLVPQADNPLGRLVLDNQAYRKSQSRGLPTTSPLEDRQYQLDVSSLSLGAGLWRQMIVVDRKFYLPAGSENPAFEWNKLLNDQEVTAPVHPILDDLNMKVTFAPAIFYDNHLVCGHSLEVNVSSQISLYIKDSHIRLASQLADELMVLSKVVLPVAKQHGKVSKRTRTPKSGSYVAQLSTFTPSDGLLTANSISIHILASGLPNPLLYAHFSQPHTYISTKNGSEKLEVSCYDMKIKTGVQPVEEAQIARPSPVSLPTETDYQIEVLETKPGVPHPKTGILPSLLTLRLTDFLDKCSLCFEHCRPLILNIPVTSLVGTSKAFDKFVNDSFTRKPHQESQVPSCDKSTEPTGKTERNESNGVGDVLMTIRSYVNLRLITLETTNIQLHVRSSEDLSCELSLQRSYTHIDLDTDLDTKSNEAKIISTFSDVFFAISEDESKKQSLIGPFSISLELLLLSTGSVYCSQFISLNCPVVPVRIGNRTHALLTKLVHDLSHVASNSKTNAGLKEQRADNPKPVSDPAILDYHDDLRMGTFSYLMDKELKLSKTHTVLFYSDQDYSALTWAYAEPRVITTIVVNPIPFDYPLSEEAGFYDNQIEILCILQYYDERTHRFVDYTNFSLSEHISTRVQLPYSETTTRSQTRTAARQWRIVINYHIETICDPQDPHSSFTSVFAMVSPAVLVAAMKVDSSFVPGLVPTHQIAVNVNQIRVSVLNQHTARSAGYHEKLKPFVMDSAEYPEHEAFQLQVNNSELSLKVWGSKPEIPLSLEASTSLTLKHVNYRDLIWKRFLHMPDLYLYLETAQKSEDDSSLSIKCNSSESNELNISQSLICSLLSTHHIWTTPSEDHHRLLTAHYTICNNVHCDVVVKQTGCDEIFSVLISPGRAHAYCWDRRSPASLCLYLSDLPDIPSGNFSIDIPGSHRVKVVTSNKDQIDLVVTVELITSIHKMITISGAVSVFSKLTGSEIEFRLCMTDGKQNLRQVNPERPFGSYAVIVSKVLGVRIRQYQPGASYSDQLSLTGEEKITLVQINGNGMNAVHSWCTIHKTTSAGVTQYCVILTPLYSIRSLLPQEMVLNILPSRHHWLKGFGHMTELWALNAAQTYQIGLQFTEQSTHAAAMMPLNLERTKELPELQQLPDDISLLQLCKSGLNDKCGEAWPTSSDKIELAGRFQPLPITPSNSMLTNSLGFIDPTLGKVNLQINWTQHHAGSKSLLMTVRPQCLLRNLSTHDIVFVFAKRFCDLQAEETKICPDELLGGKFHVGVYTGERIYHSDRIELTDEDVSPRSFFLPDEAVLFKHSFTYATVVLPRAEKQQSDKIFYFVVTSHYCDDVRILTIHDRLVLVNQIASPLELTTLIAPISASRVRHEDVNSTRIINLETQAHLNSFSLTSNASLQDGSAVMFMSFRPQGENMWSYPIQLPLESTGKLTTCLPSSKTHKSCLLTVHTYNGQTYVLVSPDTSPHVVLSNRCGFPLAYGQTLNTKSGDVLESMSLLEVPPILKPHHSISYTFPSVSKKFPSHINKEEFPRLKLAGCESHYGLELWSDGVDILDSTPVKLLLIPEVGDIKVSKRCAQNIVYLKLEPVLRAEVVAKEIQTRSGKRSTSISIEQTAQSELSSLSATDPSLYVTAESNLEEPECQSDTETDDDVKVKQLNVKLDVAIDKMDILLLDEATHHKEFLSCSLVNAQLFVTNQLESESLSPSKTPAGPTSSSNRNPGQIKLVFKLENAQMFNPLVGSEDSYDFPELFSSHESKKSKPQASSLPDVGADDLLTLTCYLSRSSSSITLTDIHISTSEMCVQVEDTYLKQIILKMDKYLSLMNILPRLDVKSHLPPCVSIEHRKHTKAIRLQSLTIDKCKVLLSVHTSLKVFIASDHAPISLRAFTRSNINTTSSQLVKDMGYHYGIGALTSAGWVLGSLEILLNPTGLIRSFRTGVSDLVYLPYYGLQRGPGAFVTGLSQGMTSMVRNVTEGTLSSLTHFALSVSRNMDRLSLDQDHFERQERNRRNKPEAFSQGLKQGLNGLAISFLGAVAGLADQPLQGVWQEDITLSHRATNLVSGVGRGLIGVITKPISGTAELISSTGHGLMGSIGLVSNAQHTPVSPTHSQLDFYDFNMLKYCWRVPVMSGSTHGQLMCSILGQTDLDLIMLLLLNDVLIVMDVKEHFQQQAFAVSEISCSKLIDGQETGSVYLQIYLDSRSKPTPNQQSPGKGYTNRVEEYMDSTSGYHTMITPGPSSLKPSPRVLLLHEYKVPPNEIDYFLTMFKFTKDYANK